MLSSNPAKFLINRGYFGQRAFFLRRVFQLFAVKHIGDTDLENGQILENIKLGQGNAGKTVQAAAFTQDHGVEPAAAPGPARGRSNSWRLRANMCLRHPAILSGRVRNPHAWNRLLTTPMILSMSLGAMPPPAHAPPATVFDEVTKGYVP